MSDNAVVSNGPLTGFWVWWQDGGMSIASKHEYRFGFLKSEDWQTIRAACLAENGIECFVCGLEDLANDVHHVFYPDDWRKTKPEHTVTLCRTCHERVHLDPNVKRNPIATLALLRSKSHPNFNQARFNELVKIKTKRLKMEMEKENIQIDIKNFCLCCKQHKPSPIRNILFVEPATPMRLLPCCDECATKLEATHREQKPTTMGERWKIWKSHASKDQSWRKTLTNPEPSC